MNKAFAKLVAAVGGVALSIQGLIMLGDHVYHKLTTTAPKRK